MNCLLFHVKFNNFINNAVIEKQNVSKAAEKLGVSQPTVSYNIHALQRELGEQLFVVDRNGIVTVSRALNLYRRLKPVYLLLVQTINDFSEPLG